MDDDIYMVLTRTHLWAVDLVQHFITTRSDKKVDGHLVSFFANINGAKRKHIYGDSFQIKYKNSVPRELVKSNIPSHPGVSLYAVYCVMTLHRKAPWRRRDIQCRPEAPMVKSVLDKSGLSLNQGESGNGFLENQRISRVEIDAAVTY